MLLALLLWAFGAGIMGIFVCACMILHCKVCNHRSLLQRALNWPLVWRLACRLIAENLPHDDVGGACLVCAAQKRRTKYQHIATMNPAHQVYCKKCGLSVLFWEASSKCKGKKAGAMMPPPRPTVYVFPLNWE